MKYPDWFLLEIAEYYCFSNLREKYDMSIEEFCHRLKWAENCDGDELREKAKKEAVDYLSKLPDAERTLFIVRRINTINMQAQSLLDLVV